MKYVSLKKYLPSKIILIIIFAFPLDSYCQYLNNPSFEGGNCGYDSIPPSWSSCRGTPDTGPFSGDTLRASEGNNYLVLVCKSWGLNEAIQQHLQDSLLKGSCYKLTF